MILGSIILALIISLAAGLSHDVDEEWSYDVEYYKPKNLSCQSSKVDLASINAPKKFTWILPTGEILRAGEKHERVSLEPNGQWLYVNRTNDEDFGVYNCLVFVNDRLTYNIRIGINIHGSYWGDLNAKYVPNMITAGVACGIMFAVATIMCFCYEKQQNKGEKAIDAYELKMQELMEMKAEEGKMNEGYEAETVPEKSPLPESELQPSVITKF